MGEGEGMGRIEMSQGSLVLLEPYLRFSQGSGPRFSWYSQQHYMEALKRARAAKEAWELGLKGQARRQIEELGKLVLVDYFERHGAVVLFEDKPGRAYPLNTSRVVVPAGILKLWRLLERFPIRQVLDYEAVADSVRVLLVADGPCYLRVPFSHEICLVSL